MSKDINVYLAGPMTGLLDDGLEEKTDKAKKAAAASKEWRARKDGQN